MKKQINMFIFALVYGLIISSQAVAAENPDELYKQGHFAEAEKIYAQKDMDRPKDIRYRYNRGCAAYRNSDFQGAGAAFSSVLRRSEDEQVQFRAFYNLGNTSFKQGDFNSAVEQYRQALLCNPQSEDARYNLELSLRELEKLKKKKGQDKQDQSKAGKKDKNKDESSSKNGSDRKSSHEKDKDNGQAKSGKQDESGKKNDARRDEGQKAEKQEPKDLSGELKPRQAMQAEQGEDQPTDPAGAMLDRKKAEALLNNLKEDRSRFLRFQVPGDKKQGVRSGKDW
ncbi:MAG: tetratricopeptide repeat protein [Deltaproteobacteria bacterium]|nr:tetratricopeptide repeat protein [Deltaproteobacteria bacterium]MBW2118569.1 tetratricopeptide repeat protein [Deltaproteobacteria bacterium]MBW2344945.1 tetratricopeptide repeat protein [Deltaproteobacteria bacterium]